MYDISFKSKIFSLRGKHICDDFSTRYNILYIIDTEIDSENENLDNFLHLNQISHIHTGKTTYNIFVEYPYLRSQDYPNLEEYLLKRLEYRK